MAFKGSDVWKIISKLKRIYNLDKSNNINRNYTYLFKIQYFIFRLSGEKIEYHNVNGMLL